MSSVRKRTWQSGGETKSAWVVDYFDQQGVRRLKTFAKKKEAEEWRTTALFEVKQGTHTADSASITVGDAGERWLRNAEQDGLEKSTTRQYRQHLDLHIRPYIGHKKLSELSVPLVNDLKRTLVEEGRSPAMVGKAISSLGALIADAQEHGLVSRNVVREMRPRRRAKSGEKRHRKRLQIGVDIPAPEEIQKIVAAAEGNVRPVIVTAIFTGMRASELRGLMWEDVDLDAKVIHVRRRADRWNNIGSPKSGAGHRAIPMTPMVANTLKEWKLACPRLGVKKDTEGRVIDPGEPRYVFPNGAGKVENHGNLYRRVFGAVQIAAGVAVDTGKRDKDDKPILSPKYGPHAFRHFYASWLLGEKARGGMEVSPKRAQTLLGHSSIQMTMDVYGHLLPPKGDEADEFAAGERALLG